MTWKKVKLGEVLKRVKNLIEIEDDKEYKLVTVKLYHKGVTLRKIAKGDELSSSKMHAVKSGEFILSGIDARHGAFGIIPAELEGAVVSNDFWCLEFDENIIDKHLFLKLTSTQFFDDLCKKASDGTTNRVRLQADKFYNLEIDLPSVDEQKLLIESFIKLEKANNEITNEVSHQLDLVSQLRQAFLREAMQGKLVPQDEADEPAASLLEKIKAEKEKLIAEKKIKRDKPLPEIKAEEIPFDIPNNWTWCRLGECSINRDGERIPISQSERERRKKIYDYYGASGVIDKIDSFTHEGRFLLVGEDGANLVARSTPIAFIAEGKFWVNNHAHVIETIDRISTDYLCNYLNGISLKPYITGGFQPKLSQGNLNLIVVPLPPLAEQKRIVEKLEKLMKFCDELETNIRESKSLATSLLQVALKEALEPKEELKLTA